METLQKTSLFWDTKETDPRKNERFVIERILAYGDEADLKWALDFYGKEKLKKYVSKTRNLDKKSLSFWRQYFNINPLKCTRKQSMTKQSAFWRK